jgi:hypothetical protein
MSKKKRVNSWKKLMRQREQERNRFGGARQAFTGNIEFDEDDNDLDEDEDNNEYEYLRAEGIRDFGVH